MSPYLKYFRGSISLGSNNPRLCGCLDNGFLVISLTQDRALANSSRQLNRSICAVETIWLLPLALKYYKLLSSRKHVTRWYLRHGHFNNAFTNFLYLGPFTKLDSCLLSGHWLSIAVERQVC